MINQYLLGDSLSSQNSETYEGKRLQYKNSVISGCFIFFKSTIGLGLVMSQYFFGQAGIGLAAICTTVSCFLIGYNMKIITEVADKIEASSELGNIKVENYDQITQFVLGKTVKIITKIFCFLFNLGIILVNIINLSKFMMGKFGSYFHHEIFNHIEFFKLVAILTILLALLFVLEPEKLKYPSYFATVVLITASMIMWIMNGQKISSEGHKFDFEYFNLKNLPPLIGNQLYAFESIGTLFTVRSTLAKPKNMHKVLRITFVFIFALFTLNGVLFLLVI